MDNVVPVLFGWVADITVLLLLPLIAILIAIPTTRRYGGQGLFIVSYLFAIFLWVSSVVAIYHFWGYEGAIFATLFFGIGPLLISPILYVSQGLWADMSCFIVLVGLLFVARRAGAYVVKLADQPAEAFKP